MHDLVAAPRDEQDKRYAPASWVLAAREARGLTQDAMSRRLDVASMTISKRERGVIKVPWENWLGMLHALDLPAGWEPGHPVPNRDAPSGDGGGDVQS
jgi:hypothetical protein